MRRTCEFPMMLKTSYHSWHLLLACMLRSSRTGENEFTNDCIRTLTTWSPNVKDSNTRIAQNFFSFFIEKFSWVIGRDFVIFLVLSTASNAWCQVYLPRCAAKACPNMSVEHHLPKHVEFFCLPYQMVTGPQATFSLMFSNFHRVSGLVGPPGSALA